MELLKLHSSLNGIVSYINRKNTIVLKCEPLKLDKWPTEL